MKSIITAMCLATALVSYAQDAAKDNSASAPAHAMPEAVLKKTGGIVTKRGEGKIVIVNCQNAIDEKTISERANRLGRLLKCNVEIRRGDWSVSAKVPDDANFAIYIIRDGKLPMSLVAAESGWGAINTVGLDSGDRFSKELTRVFALTVGAMCSRNINSPMQPVSNPQSLDKVLTDNIMRDMIDSLRINMKARGMTEMKVATYRKACQEGWAPEPTNDVQRTIWKQVHAIPDKPITIEFDPKKDK